MPNLKNIANAFLDGIGSLASVFEPAERPGSRENLMAPTPSRISDIYFSSEAALRRSEGIQEMVLRLRKNADAIESRNNTLRQAVTKEATTAHGVR